MQLFVPTHGSVRMLSHALIPPSVGNVHGEPHEYIASLRDNNRHWMQNIHKQKLVGARGTMAGLHKFLKTTYLFMKFYIFFTHFFHKF